MVYNILDSFNKNSEESDRRLQWDEELTRQRWTGIVLYFFLTNKSSEVINKRPGKKQLIDTAFVL